MKNVVGVRLRNTGDSSYYEPNGMDFSVGDSVIVEKDSQKNIGYISTPLLEVDEERIDNIGVVIRKATEDDIEKQNTNKRDENEAYRICLEKIKAHELPMKLIQAEYTFERNKLIFYFTADGRVDFRELVKDLAAIFHTRIELRQVGVRDETKFLGGLGICGREFCCGTFLTEFAPVSIKMAKEQKLSLNPTKISGVCGRLMCCLKNEEETYEYLNKQLPGKGEIVRTSTGKTGTVFNVNVLKQTVSVLFEENDEKEMCDFPVTELSFKRRKKELSDNTTDDVMLEEEFVGIGEQKEQKETKEQKPSAKENTKDNYKKRGKRRAKRKKKSPVEA